MPTREQIEAIAERLELLVGKYAGLSLPELAMAIEEDVEFEGFTEQQIHDIEQRIYDGEAADFWFDGIEPDEDIAEMTPTQQNNAEFFNMLEDIANPPSFEPKGDYDRTD